MVESYIYDADLRLRNFFYHCVNKHTGLPKKDKTYFKLVTQAEPKRTGKEILKQQRLVITDFIN